MGPLIAPRWTVPTPANFGRPAFTRGLVIFGQQEGNAAGSCRAVRLSDGTDVWRLATASFVDCDLQVEHGTAYFCGAFFVQPLGRYQSFAFAVDAATGIQRWRTSVDPWLAPTLVLWNDRVLFHGVRDGGPAPSPPQIIVSIDKATGGDVRLVDIGAGNAVLFVPWNNGVLMARDGRSALEFLDPATLTVRTITGTPGPIVDAALSGDRCYVADNGQGAGHGRLTAIHLPDGAELWRQTYDMNAESVFAQEGVVAVTMRAGGQLNAPAEIWRLDVDNGGILWKIAAGNRTPILGTLMRQLLLVQMRVRDVQPGSTVTAALDVRDGRERLRYDHAFSTEWVVDAGNGLALASHFDLLVAIDTVQLWAMTVGGAVRGTPALSSGSVIIGNANGVLSAIGLDGQPRWTRATGGAIEGTPAVSQGRIFAGHAAGVTAFEGQTGQQVWSIATPQPVTSPILASPQAVVFGCRDNSIRAVSPANGSPLWSFPTTGFVEGGAAFADGRYYSGSADGQVYALDTAGQLVWRFVPPDIEIDEIKSTPLVVDDVVIIGNAAGHLYALYTASGAVKWHRKLDGGVRTSSPLLHTEHFWIADESGHVYHILLDDGSIDWKAPVAGAGRGLPAWLAAELYVGTMAGTLDVLDIFTGMLRRRVNVGAPVFASPVIAPEFIVVADESGGVHAIVPGP